MVKTLHHRSDVSRRFGRLPGEVGFCHKTIFPCTRHHVTTSPRTHATTTVFALASYALSKRTARIFGGVGQPEKESFDRDTLERYQACVAATADFMADYAHYDWNRGTLTCLGLC